MRNIIVPSVYVASVDRLDGLLFQLMAWYVSVWYTLKASIIQEIDLWRPKVPLLYLRTAISREANPQRDSRSQKRFGNRSSSSRFCKNWAGSMMSPISVSQFSKNGPGTPNSVWSVCNRLPGSWLIPSFPTASEGAWLVRNWSGPLSNGKDTISRTQRKWQEERKWSGGASLRDNSALWLCRSSFKAMQ